MKKIFIVIVFAVFAVMANSCGIARNRSITGAYVDYGEGESMDRGIARDKAISDALFKISNSYSVSVDGDTRRMYVSKESNRGRGSETNVYEQNSKTRTNSNINDYKVIYSRCYRKPFSRHYRCRVKVSVDFENVN